MLRLRTRVACPELVEGLSTNGALACYVFSPFVLSVAAPAAKSKDTASAHRFDVDALVVCFSPEEQATLAFAPRSALSQSSAASESGNPRAGHCRSTHAPKAETGPGHLDLPPTAPEDLGQVLLG